VFWNGILDRFFQISLSSELSTNLVYSGAVPSVVDYRLGNLFTLALLLWIRLSLLFPSPVTLAVLQVTLITVADLVLYSLAQKYL
jgi:uncharacterized membrane protein